jgi:hypothetical protein
MGLELRNGELGRPRDESVGNGKSCFLEAWEEEGLEDGEP